MSCDIIFSDRSLGRVLAPNGTWTASSEDGKTTKIHYVGHNSPMPLRRTDISIPFDIFVLYTQECKKDNGLADVTDDNIGNIIYRITPKHPKITHSTQRQTTESADII